MTDSEPTDSELPGLRLVDPTSAQAISHQQMLSSLSLLVASGLAQTKASLGRLTGLPRSSVSAHVDTMLRRRIVEHSGLITAERGRPAERLIISPSLGIILIADVGVAHASLAVADMNLQLLGHQFHVVDLRAAAPDEYLTWVAGQLTAMAEELAPGRNFGLCVLGLPARIDTRYHYAVRPPNIPGWDGFDASTDLSNRLGCPVVIENDVNLRALGEAAALPLDQLPILTVKIASGIGAGLVDGSGHIYHGFDGAAGEIGHTPLSQGPQILCRCGNTGCLEAVAAVPSMLASLRALGNCPDNQATTVEDLIARLHTDDAAALRVVRESGRAVGEIVAMLCNALNPRRVVITGLVTQATDEILANVRTTVYQLARPLATRNLIIAHSALGQLSGVAGGMVLGAQTALSPPYLFRRHKVKP